MPKDTSIQHILILGSGPIIIGQACEFDYSGSQASRAIREEGIKVSLLNDNPATIMTDPMIADHIYLKSLKPETIVEILSSSDIDAVLPTMGGQTALNLAKECSELGIWEKHNVRVLGADLNAIEKTENREEFRQFMMDIGIKICPSKVANSFLEGKSIAQELGFPLVIRPSYTLGGYGGGFVFGPEDFDEKLTRGLEASPTHEVLIEKAVIGWKEYELELLR
ncbi:MAG: carbamoyl-phosphate synthase large subunit, partial [Bacteroidota bacterium]|nr:carbamoyl-phosphate synthase large subunit [Bacteroidota bacterium]